MTVEAHAKIPTGRPPSVTTRLLAVLIVVVPSLARAADPIRDLQKEYVAKKNERVERAYHFGSQGKGSVFSNHTQHTNRLLPFYTFGNAIDPSTVIGINSLYRDSSKIKALYGFEPANTLNPDAEYCDQSDFAKLQRDAIRNGAKHLFIVWFDGLDWDTTRAAAIAKTGKVYTEGKGSGLLFQDYDAKGTATFGYYVTSPTHDKHEFDVDKQTVTIPANSMGGGYDFKLGGAKPWAAPKARGYLKGQSADEVDREEVTKAAGVLHAYTDSSTSAAEFVSGVKSYNNGLNVTDDGKFVESILFHELQAKGWKVGTATSVPFDHASPAAMYAQNVYRNDYQDIGRAMLGQVGIVQEAGKYRLMPGLDVVIGTGFGQSIIDKTAKEAETRKKDHGMNMIVGNNYITATDKGAIDVKNGGKYVVVETTSGMHGGNAVRGAARRAANEGKRLFGLFGSEKFDHLPYRTVDGRFDPVEGIRGNAESYSQTDLIEQPTLADMTEAALTVLSAAKGKPFALFVEAGDVDYGLHDNNLDNAIGAVYSGEAALKVVFDWVEANSNWDESVVIVTGDHGHYLVVDDPEALAKAAKK